MAWRSPTKKDLAATLSQAEIDLFKKSPEFQSAEDPQETILKDVAAMIRSHIRRNRQITMAPGQYEIPESLMSYAMDFAAFRILKRFGKVVNESRTKAYEDARDQFNKVSNNEVTVESWTKEESDETGSNMALPKFGSGRRKILNEQL